MIELKYYFYIMKISGFLNVFGLDNAYRLGEKVHKDYYLKNLEFIVRMHGLKWGVSDKKIRMESF